MRRLALVGVVAVLLGVTVSAQEKSGLQPGTADKPTVIPNAFSPYNATKDRKGKYHCLVCRHGLNPVAVVFARRPPANSDEPLAKVLVALDEALEKHKRKEFGSFAVFLSDATGKERDALAGDLEKLDQSLSLKRLPLTIEKADGPDNWQINKEAEVTVLLYYDYEVKANFSFFPGKPLAEKDVETILEAVKKLVDLKPK